jgi:hypothetical protein
MRILSCADRSTEAVTGALLSALPSAEAELVRQLGDSNWLACATVAARERAAGRLIVSDEDVGALLDLTRSMGIHTRVGQARMLQRPSPVRGTYHNGAFTFEPCAGSSAIVYFGVTPRLTEGAEQAEMLQDHSLIGRLFGYPECCVRAFAENTSPELDKLPSTVTSVGPFARAMNPVVPYVFGCISLLFHFPCSLGCRASLSIWEGRQRFLEGIAPEAAALRDLGAGVALYGPEVGIGLITSYRHIADGEIAIDEVVTGSAMTVALFDGLSRCTMRLSDPHRFDLGGHRFDSPNGFAARFV